MTDNRHVFPVRFDGGARTIVRPGLAVSVIVGLVSALTARRGLVGSCDMDLDNVPVLLLAGTSVLIGAVSAHALTRRADVRLLHTAVCRAAASPVAHPDTIAAMEVAAPAAVLEAASRLVLRHRR